MDVSQQEFPGMPEPIEMTVAASLLTPAQRISHFAALEKKHGGLVPVNVLAPVLGLTTARISQFKGAGRFTLVEFMGREFTPLHEVEAFAAKERLNGRPRKESVAS